MLRHAEKLQSLLLRRPQVLQQGAVGISADDGMGMGIGNDLHDLRLLIKLLRYFTAPRSTFQTVR